MRIHYRETESGIEIVRCFGADGKVELPAVISGMPVTRAAAYAFSARKAQEDEDVLVCETEDGRLFGSRSNSLPERQWRVLASRIRWKRSGNISFTGAEI